MLRITKVFLIGSAFMLVMVNLAVAHCEIPCGIYGDEMRIQMILENITTIEKSMQQITSIEQEKPLNSNQLVRWVMNKEKHADDLQEIVSQYFLTQRIKPEAENYQALLSNLHEMLVVSMKCKQTTDLTNVSKLRELVTELEKLYFGKPHDHK
jgi:nickel superoxide dismutase